MDEIIGIIVDHHFNSEVIRLALHNEDDGLTYEVIMLNVNPMVMLVHHNQLSEILSEPPGRDWMKSTKELLMGSIDAHQGKGRVAVCGARFSSSHYNPWTGNFNVGISLLTSGGYLFFGPTEGIYSVNFIHPAMSNITDRRYRIRNDVDMAILSTKEVDGNIILTLPLQEQQVRDFVVYVDGREVDHTLLTSSEMTNNITITFPRGKTNCINANFTPNGFPTLSLTF